MKRIPIVAMVLVLCQISVAQVRVACIGDSITYGSVLEDRDTQSYPSLLAVRLGPGYDVRNFGCSGCTASPEGDYPYIGSEQYGALKSWLPDVVTIMLGTNDTKPHNWNEESFRKGYDTIIRQVKNLPSHPQIKLLLPPPVWNSTSMSDSLIRGSVIPAIRALGKHHWLDVVDVNSVLSSCGECSGDGIHPDARGTALIAGAVYDEFSRSGLTGKPGLRILFIGDSITDGDWGKKDSRPSGERNHYDMNHIYGHGYMAEIATTMLLDHPEAHFRFFNRGIGGDRLSGVEARWQEDVMAVRPDVISVLIGINDSWGRNYEDFDFDGWDKTYRSLLDRTLSVNPDTRFVLCTPFYGDPNLLVERLASIVRTIAYDYGAVCVDFAQVIDDLRGHDRSGDGHYWLWDRIHPTYQAHRVLAREWLSRTGLNNQ